MMRSTNKTYNLFEFSDPVRYDGSIDTIDAFLDEIWRKREKVVFDFWETNKQNIDTPQRFIQFFRKNNTFRSTKYVGIIHYKGQVINLLPKIFDDGNTSEYKSNHIESIQRHILWWLSYCGKFKFPKSKSSFSSVKTDFFEIMVYLFASYTRDVLHKSIYQGYQEVEKDIPYMKGKLNVGNYVNRNLVNGNIHKLNCTYDSFEMDNQFNRIIKSVAKLLITFSKSKDNIKLLQEIIFILDEVKDVQASYNDCRKVRLNPLFDEMFTILDYCKLFLSNSTVLSYKNEFDVFAFLVPMEYIFEDFIYGFLKKELGELSVKSQQGTSKLTTDGAFQLRPDLVINLNGKKIIADTKYKMVYPGLVKNKKKGISETDMYQMLTYAVRNKADEIKLLYPSTVNDPDNEEVVNFNIKDEFALDSTINIRAHKLPIITENWKELDAGKSIEVCFEEATEKLRVKLKEVFI
jgi:5-methylcytosine-specific restriction enzyme subunit McrC